MQQMYHPSDLASMDPLVLMKNLDHVRMTSRRLSYILQQQVHLYTPEANQLREQIDRYVEDRLHTLLVQRAGSRLRGGCAEVWRRPFFEALGLCRLRGTIQYPGAA